MLTKDWIREKSLYIVIALFFMVMQLTKWPPLFYWGWWGGGNFLDTWQVLKSADCYKSIGLEVYDTNNDCMVYPYGRPLLWILNFLQIGEAQTKYFGVTLLVIVALSLGFVLKTLKTSIRNLAILSTAVVCSPPILLLADRGNIDALMLGGIFLAIWFLNKKRNIFAQIIVFTITLFKYYTFPVLVLISFINKSWREKISGIFLSIIAALSIYRDLAITQFEFSLGTPHLTFGIGHEFLFLRKYNKLSWMGEHSQLLGVLLISIVAAFFYFSLARIDYAEVLTESSSTMNRLYVLSTLIILSCYLSGFNADYRLVFFVISAIAFIQIIQSLQNLKELVYGLLITSLWLTYPSGDLEILGDLSLAFYVSLNIAFALQLLKKRKLNSLF